MEEARRDALPVRPGVLNVEGLNDLIGDHPGAVVLVFGAMWGVLVFLGGLVARFAKREFNRIEAKESEQDTRLIQIERDIQGEDSKLSVLFRDLTAHIADEAEMKKTVNATHDAVLRIGNGQMLVLSQKLSTVERKVDGVDAKVEAHNTEAEMWKRKIERNELRLDHIEGGRK
jgi:hypothetical protein